VRSSRRSSPLLIIRHQVAWQSAAASLTDIQHFSIVKQTLTYDSLLAGQPSVTVKVVADAKGQRRPAVTLTASHQTATFVPANSGLVPSGTTNFSTQGATFLGGGYTLPPGSFVTTSAGGFGHPTACFIAAPAVCFAPQGATFAPAPAGYGGAGGPSGPPAPIATAEGGEALQDHESEMRAQGQAQPDGADRFVS
jgi:hypothetical protein